MVLNDVKILLVEDSPADARLIIEVLKDFKIKTNVNLVEDGIKAMEFLNQQGKYKNMPKPDLIILDLNLPKMDGRKVLKQIKKDENLKCIPVVILTTSSIKEDIIYTYKNHANCYIKKPLDINHFMDIVGIIESFWFTAVTLPSKLT